MRSASSCAVRAETASPVWSNARNCSAFCRCYMVSLPRPAGPPQQRQAIPSRRGIDRLCGRSRSAKMMMANRPIQGRSALAQQAVKYGWDHVHLRTTDPETMAQWFESTLGAEIIRSMQQGKPRIDLKLGGANIFIAPVAPSDGVNAAPVTPYRGLDHFGLTVSGIEAVASELKKKGVEFTREPTTVRPGVRICFLRGPEGVSIELLDRDPKY